MKKIIFLKKIKISYLIFFLLIIIFVLKTNFLRNLLDVLKYSENDRVEKIYGYCGGQSIGYLRYLKKKYKIETNPMILNYSHTPPVKWSIYETSSLNNNKDQIIILNYPPLEVDLSLANDLSRWIELVHYKDNLYELKDAFYYFGLYKTLEKIHIKDLKAEITNLKFYIKDEAKNLKMVKNLQITKNGINNNFILDQKLNNFDVKGKKIFFQFDNIRDKTKIFIYLKPKYDLNDYKIIDKFKDCYFVE